MMQLVNNNNQREREPSVSYEGTDIVFEDLLGDLLPQNKNKKPLNGNNKPLKAEPATIDDLFHDIFDVPVEESEQTSIFTDDEESEGWDPNNTTFEMPSNNTDNVDVFDSILKDLDEKTKEIEKNKDNKPKPDKTKKKKKPPKPKPKPVPSNPSNSSQPSPKPSIPSIPPSITIHIDENPAYVIDEDTTSKLEAWEFDDKSVRRNIRILLSTLGQVLPDDLQNKWKAITMSDLLNDTKVRKQYFKAIRIVHPDKSIGRGDDMETKIICNYIFQALETAYSKDSK